MSQVIIHSALAVEGQVTENGLDVLTELEAASEKAVSLSSPASNVGWRDITSEVIVRGTGSASPVWSQLGSSPFHAYQFTVGRECWLNFHINHDYKPGGQILLHVHWTTAGTSTIPVVWELTYAVAKGHNQTNGGTFPYAAPPYYTGTVQLSQAPSGVPFRHMVTEMTQSINVTNAEVDSIIMVHLKRISAGSSNNNDPVFVLTADCHYESDRVFTLNKAPNFYE